MTVDTEDHGDGDDTQAVRKTLDEVPPEEVPDAPDADAEEAEDEGDL